MLGRYLKGVVVDLGGKECVVCYRIVTFCILKIVHTTCNCHIVKKYDLYVHKGNVGRGIQSKSSILREIWVLAYTVRESTSKRVAELRISSKSWFEHDSGGIVGVENVDIVFCHDLGISRCRSRTYFNDGSGPVCLSFVDKGFRDGRERSCPPKLYDRCKDHHSGGLKGCARALATRPSFFSL